LRFTSKPWKPILDLSVNKSGLASSNSNATEVLSAANLLVFRFISKRTGPAFSSLSYMVAPGPFFGFRFCRLGAVSGESERSANARE
jgi:hypothetical protein